MRINTNVASLNAQEAAKNTSNKLTSSLEKLSTGLRINKAADDASGLSIADKLRTQANAIGQGISNANAANSLIQIADKAMAEQSNILDTIKTKLIQASTSTTSEDGREAIRKDVVKLLEQFDNISAQTNYNGINLLNTKDNEFNFQVGEDKNYDISLKTAYAVNTDGLGSTTEAVDTTPATFSYGSSSGFVSISEDDVSLSVQNKTTASGNKGITIGGSVTSTAAATDSSFSVSATNVESITFHATAASAGSKITLTTDDAETIAILDAIAGNDDSLTRVDNGTYTFSAVTTAGGLTAAVAANPVLDFNGGKIDISNLTISGLGQGPAAASTESVTFETDDEVTITKLSGTKNLSIDASTIVTSTGAETLLGNSLVGSESSITSGIAYNASAGGSMALTDGTISLKIVNSDTDVATDDVTSVGINTGSNLLTAASDASFSVSATNVEKIIMKMSAASNTGSVTMYTEDAATISALNALADDNESLTAIGNGMYTFTATAATKDAVLDFGDTKVDISNLSFSGVQKGTAANTTETIYVQTADAVEVTKSDTVGNIDISIDGYMGKSQSAAQAFTTVETSTSSISDSLSVLKNLGENELTVDIANSFMSTVDSALTQLNSVRSDFGSTQNQLDSAVRNMMTVQTNIKAAESIIRDVDYAEESANFNKQNIIAQAGSYAMSQSNAIQQNVLRLLQ